MEKVSALGDASSLEVLVANGAYVAVSLQLLLGGFIQGSDARDGSSAVNEHPPAIFGLAPDVEVCMDAHHQGPDGTPRLKEHDPGPIAKQKDAKQELNGVAQGLDIVDIIVQLFPEVLLVSVHHEEGVDSESDEHLDDDLHAEGGHGQEPGADLVVLPQVHHQPGREHHQHKAHAQGTQVVGQNPWAGGADIHEQRVDHAVHEVEDGRGQEAEVAVQPHQAPLNVHPGQACLQRQDEEEHGGDRPDAALLLLVSAQHPGHQDAQVGRHEGQHGGEAEQGHPGLAAPRQQVVQQLPVHLPRLAEVDRGCLHKMVVDRLMNKPAYQPQQPHNKHSPQRIWHLQPDPVVGDVVCDAYNLEHGKLWLEHAGQVQDPESERLHPVPDQQQEGQEAG